MNIPHQPLSRRVERPCNCPAARFGPLPSAPPIGKGANAFRAATEHALPIPAAPTRAGGRVVLLLLLCLLAGCLAIPVRADQFGDFTYTDRGTYIEITGYSQEATGPVEIPMTINGKPVTHIGAWAFSECTLVTSVTFPPSSAVTSIGDGAFSGCTLVTSVTFAAPSAVSTIGRWAFQGCVGVTSISLPSSVASIGREAFDGCSGLASFTVEADNANYSSQEGVLFNKAMTLLIRYPQGLINSTYSIPPSVTSIDSGAFYWCGALTGLNIPSSVKSIGHWPFRECSRLTSITVEADNPNFSSHEGVLFNKTKTTLFCYPQGLLVSSYTIPPSVRTIAAGAFDGCGALTSIMIPGSVTSIENNAFSGCSGLTTIEIPASVTIIWDGAFAGCSALTSVTFAAPSSITNMGSGIFSGCKNLSSIIIPASVTTIGSGAFTGCESLSSVSFATPSSLTTIGSGAFSGLSALERIIIPESVTEIGFLAFGNCGALTSITIPASVTSIGSWAFGNCASLSGVTFAAHSSLTSIGSYAFYGCKQLTSVIIPASVTSIGYSAFDNTRLSNAVFLGDAPSMGGSVFLNTAGAFKIFHVPGKSGFTTPTWDGWRSETLSATHGISVIGPHGVLSAGWSMVSFGTVSLSESSERIFTIINTGNAEINSLEIALGGEDPDSFMCTQAAAPALALGDHTASTVTFAPDEHGTHSAILRIVTDGNHEDHFEITVVGQRIDPNPPINPSELLSPHVTLAGENVEFLIGSTVSRRRYQIQQSDTLAAGTWVDVGPVWTGDGAALVITIPREPQTPRRFYRVALDPVADMNSLAYIPAGEFLMGDEGQMGYVRPVFVSALYMSKYEVTKALWDEVRAWGMANGYTDLRSGWGKAANHPVHGISWFDMVKWCNARSEMEGLPTCYTVDGTIYKTGSNNAVECDWNANGYRLPTEAEWEKAARGGLVGRDFPWGTNTISHSQANYYSDSLYSYDISPTRGNHPLYSVASWPYTSAVGSFAPNGYGLYDMAGNISEWCWDWYNSSYYHSSPNTDPRGPLSGSSRVLRGGGWNNFAYDARAANRRYSTPGIDYKDFGFRPARSTAP